jgi:hypothetical protein
MPFCRSCGKELVAEAKFCPQCGTSVGASEKQLALFENVQIVTGLISKNFDIYITDRRIVGIHKYVVGMTGSVIGLAGVAGGLAEMGIKKLREGDWKDKQEQMKEMTLDEKLAIDEKSFSLLYSDVVEMKLRDPFGYSLRVKGGNVNVSIPLVKKQFEQLKELLPTIPALAGKVRVPTGRWPR